MFNVRNFRTSMDVKEVRLGHLRVRSVKSKSKLIKPNMHWSNSTTIFRQPKIWF